MQKNRYLIVVACVLFALLTDSFAHTHPIDSINRVLNLTSEERIKVDLLNAMGKYYAKRQFDSVQYYTQKALKLAKAVNYLEGEIRVYNLQAESAFSVGKITEGNKYLEQARVLATTSNSKKGMGDNLYAQSIFFQTKGEYAKSLELLNSALVFYEEINDLDGLCSIYIGIGKTHSDLRQYKRSIAAYKKALEESKKLKKQDYIARIHNNIANIHQFQQNYTEGLAHYQQALDIAKQMDNKLLAGICYSNMGIIYEELEYYDQAKENYGILLELAKQINNEYYLFACYDNFGNVYRKEKKYIEAEDYYKQALDIATKLDSPPLLALCFDNIGNVKRHTNNYKEAIVLHEKAIEIYEKIGQEQELAHSKIGLAESYKGLNQPQKALGHALEAYHWVNQHEESEDIILRNASEVIAKLYEQNGDFEQAYIFHKKYKAANDKLQDADMIRAVAIQKTKEDYDKKAAQEAMTTAAEKKTRNTILGVVGACLFLLFTFGMYSYSTLRRKNKVIEQQHKEISAKHEELQVQTSELTQLNITKDKLFAIVSHDLRGPISGLESVLSMLLSKEMSEEDFLDMASDLKQNTTNVHQMLDNLLQWSYAQIHDGLSTAPTILSPKKQTESVLNFLGELIKEKELSVQNTICPDLLIKSDLNHTNLILRNLISNAIKFTKKKGDIEIGVEKTGDMAVFFVKDTGIGMTEEQIRWLFIDGNPNSRWGTAGEKGVGLGLELCKEMITKNGGKIWAESTIEKGSTFFFSLPITPQVRASEVRNVRFSFADQHLV